MKSMRACIIFFLLILSVSSYSKDQFSDSEIILGVLSSLDSISNKETNNNYVEEDSIPDFVSVIFDPSDQNAATKEIQGLVRTFYSDPANQVSMEDVLGFLTNAYSEHDFHESGNWAKEAHPKNSHINNHYVPYSGTLPQYSILDFQTPLSGKITSSYGYRPARHRFHQGIDISAETGDSVISALPGIIIKTGYEKKGYGYYIVVAHSGDLETIYAHLNKIIVSPGQSVIGGEVIGFAGSTGNSTGPHLHFETRYRGLPVNPYSWFNISGIW